MNTGETTASKPEQNPLPVNRNPNNVDVLNKVAKPASTTHATSKFSATTNATFKTKSTTTATVSKITKLVLKPKPSSPKSSLTSKVTTKKYISKPVTIKSRSTMISHESTFRIRNIKTTPKQRQSEENSLISIKNGQISRKLMVNRNDSNVNERVDRDNQFEMIHTAHSATKTLVNETNVLDSPILQEITSTVVNSSEFVKSSSSTFVDKKVSESVKENAIHRSYSETEPFKPKDYDPIKARQFIKKQMDTRKDSEKEKAEKVPASKEEIKQRLSALRKNTLKIVEKNVQKARKTNVKATNSKTFTPKAVNTPKRNNVAKQTGKKAAETKLHQNDYQTPQPRVAMTKISPDLALTPSKFVPSIKTDKLRIGILRRAEKLPTANEPSPIVPPAITSTTVEHNLESHVLSPEKSFHSTSIRTEECDFGLKVPDTLPLKSELLYEISHHSLHDDEPFESHYGEERHFEHGQAPSNEVPFWLRPTPVQPYPYNFIMAVRKKLESITHPVLSPESRKRRDITTSSIQQQSFHSPLARPVTRFEPHHPLNLDRKQSESDRSASEHVKSSDVSPVKSFKHVESSSEHERYSNDFSNRSLHSKSKRKSIGRSEDTLSISSGILSHSSPEKKMRTNTSKTHKEEDNWQPSPLTTDYVDGLHITSRSLPQSGRPSNASAVSRRSVQPSVTSHINFGRGKDYSDQNAPSFNKLSKQHSVEELLDDFKASLSAAIEVNQRLHNVLSHPPSSRLTQYSDDFEHASDNKSDIGEEIIEPVESETVSAQKTQSYISEEQSSVQRESSSTTEKVTEVSSRSNKTQSYASSRSKLAEEFSNIISNQMSTISSQKSDSTRSVSNEPSMIEESVQRGISLQPDEMSRSTKISSTMIEEKLDDYESSESPTNNDLKSVSLSIAKKSAPTTDDDTDQPSNAIESFSKHIQGEPDVANESIGSDIFTIFNKTSLNLNEDMNGSIWSEHNISYSTLGMCDQLLKSEARKSEDLSSLLKIREKSLIDRFKGQIAWLELQKQKLKESGLTTEISMIKKKQRALLLRLNNDRKELHRILKERNRSESARNAANVNFNISHMSTNMSIRRTSFSKQLSGTTGKRALKAIELPGGGTALETMLQKREDELRRRREHVEKLLNWHERLDVEEQEVIKMEQMIMFTVSTSDVYQTTSHEQINDTLAITVQHHSKRLNCQRGDDHSVDEERSLANVSDSVTMERTRFEHKKQKQIHKIEQSLNTLKMVSSRSISSIDGSNIDDFVEILGRHLNKLWKRLTGQYEEKYTPDKVYTVGKSDLELMYEQAKTVVLKQFHANAEFKRRLIDNSMSIIEGSQNQSKQPTDKSSVDKSTGQDSIVPTLNLASSPEPRENAISDTDQGFYFSNSNNEQISTQKQTITESQQSIDVSTVDDESENLNDSQIQTEEHAAEDESVQDDVQSDITEDSLNKTKPTSFEDISQTEIQTVSHANGSGASSQIPSAIETSHTSVPIELNTSNNNSQLIEETSFPNIDIHTTISSAIESDNENIVESVSPIDKPTVASQPSDDQQYESDHFEESKSADELTSISTATVTKVTTTNQSSVTPKTESPQDLEHRLILIDEGLKELNETISKSPVLHSEADSSNTSESENATGNKSPSTDIEDDTKPTETGQSEENSDGTAERETATDTKTTENEASVAVNETSKVDSDESTDSIAAEIAASNIDTQTSPESPKRQYQYTLSATSIDYNKVPEADALKRAHIPTPTEDIATEQSSAMFPLLREIPNKPPPPYPVHRQLPKTEPFPSDERIKELVFSRVVELYERLNSSAAPETPVRCNATFVKSPTLSISSPDSPANPCETNVFERIILDSCDEIMQEIKSQDMQTIGIFRQPLEFYNPPNRLKCCQQHTLKRIFKLLNRSCSDSVRADEPKSYTGMRSFLPSQVAQLTFNNRRKRDAVDDILIQELYEDETRWTNFDLEEKEIRDNLVDLKELLADDSSDTHEVSTNATNTE